MMMNIASACMSTFTNSEVRVLHPHDYLMERAWQNCRAGLAICQRDRLALKKALAFSHRAKAVAPTHMQRWIEILNNQHQEHIQLLFDTERFLALTPLEQAWWDQLIQSAPFVPVLAKQKTKSKKQKAHNAKQTHMTLEQFDHICRAAAAVAGTQKVYVFGANAIIPWLVQAGHSIPLSGFVPSRELDLSVGDEKMDTLIDGSIGELSVFDQTFAVYAHGVSLSAFQAPANWQKRAGKRTEPVHQIEIIAPHPHDLIISKLAIGRPKDFDFAVVVARLFPMTDAELNNLLDEFRAVHSQAVAALHANVEIWKRRRE